MDIAEFATSIDTVIRIILLLVYAPVCLTSYRWLIPRLTPDAKRLASGFLTALVILIAIALEYRPTSEFERWLWHPDMEWNIPSIISSTQLALVGYLALVTAILDRNKRPTLRLYLVALGLFVLFLGLDEFFSWKSFTSGLQSSYVRLGAAMAVGTMIVAAVSPRRERIWYICLLTGFALIATGALVVDQNPRPCGSFGPLYFDGCMRAYILEEALEFLGAWLALIATLGLFSVIAASPSPRLRLSLYAMPGLWILLITHFSPSHNIEVNSPDLPASVEFESGTHLYGYRKDVEGLPSSIVLRLPDVENTSGIGFSIHVLDQVSGVSVFSSNDFVDRREKVWPKRRGYVPLYRQAIDLKIPPQTPSNHAFSIVLTLWREVDGQYTRQKIVASDHKLIDRTQVMLGELVVPAASTVAQTVTRAVFDNGFALSAVDLPERVQAGEILKIAFTWRTDVAGQEDIVQYLHLGHVSPPREGGSVEGGAESVESGEWFVYDQQPLGPRLPTRLWYSGLADSETWHAPLPADLAPGRYSVFTGLYRARDQERIPASDAKGSAFVDARVPLGSLLVAR